MSQFGCLGADSRLPLGVGGAHRQHSDAGGKVNVLLALQVVQGGPLSVVDGNGVAAIGLDNILLVQLFQFFKGQW